MPEITAPAATAPSDPTIQARPTAFHSASPTPADQPVPYTLTEKANVFGLIEEMELTDGVKVIYKRYGDLYRIAYDPAQIDRSTVDAFLGIYIEFTEARLFGQRGDVRLLNAPLPAGEPSRRINEHLDGPRTWVWDDRQVSPQQMLDILERVHADTPVGA